MIEDGIVIGIVPVYNESEEEYNKHLEKKKKEKFNKYRCSYENIRECSEINGLLRIWEIDDLIGVIKIITDGIDIEYKIYKKTKTNVAKRKIFRDMMYIGLHFRINENFNENDLKNEIVSKLLSFGKEIFKNKYIKYDDFQFQLEYLNLLNMSNDLCKKNKKN